MLINRPCITIISSVLFYLLSFSNSSAEFDSSTNKTLEKRLHNIYVNHYNRPVLDSDWFKIVEAIEVQKHSVQPGDTLWGISKVYFGDGNYWSKLWSVNKSITNPHMIFVGDGVKFRTGSFESTPGIDIEKNGTNAALYQAAGSSEPVAPLQDGLNSDDIRPVQKLPDFFVASAPFLRTDDSPIAFIERPQIKYKSEFMLTRDILEQPPEVVGKINSLGEFRLVTAEGSIVLLDAEDTLTEGASYSLIKKDSGRTESGFPIHIQGVVQVIRKIDGNMYEAKLIHQFETIEVGDLVSTYQTLNVNVEVGESQPIAVPIKLLTNVRSVWTDGDPIFLETIDAGKVSVGDVLKINNKFVDRIEYYVSNGFIKIVSVHPPYATGVVISSRELIRKNSVSDPTYTGWSVW